MDHRAIYVCVGDDPDGAAPSTPLPFTQVADDVDDDDDDDGDDDDEDGDEAEGEGVDDGGPDEDDDNHR
jgi:hypothetical protein